MYLGEEEKWKTSQNVYPQIKLKTKTKPKTFETFYVPNENITWHTDYNPLNYIKCNSIAQKSTKSVTSAQTFSLLSEISPFNKMKGFAIAIILFAFATAAINAADKREIFNGGSFLTPCGQYIPGK